MEKSEETGNLLNNFLKAASELITDAENSGESNYITGSKLQLNDGFDKALTAAAAERKEGPLLNSNESKKTEIIKYRADSDDENYNEYGSSIQHLMKTSKEDETRKATNTLTWKSNNIKQLQACNSAASNKNNAAVAMFGFNVSKPLISSASLQELITGKDLIYFAKLKYHLAKKEFEKDWVIIGVIINKLSRTSQAGKLYTIWTLCDMQHEMKTVGVFLFGSTHKQMTKIIVGTLVGILNPNVLEKRSGTKDEAAFSVDNPQKIMVIGQSKDLGTCKSVRKNGEKCTTFVNLSKCQHCVYHVKQEYQNCSRRAELQSHFAGRGLTALRNKVLGKNEVFYAGKSYTAIPSKSNRKLNLKDENRLQALSGNISVMHSSGESSIRPNNLELSNRKTKDLEILNKLGNSQSVSSSLDNGTFNTNLSTVVNFESSRQLSRNVIDSLKEKRENNRPQKPTGDTLKSLAYDIPMLSGEINKKPIDLSSPVSKKLVDRARLNAYKYVQRNGPIKRQDPNSVRTQSAKKRPLESDDSGETSKKAKTEVVGFASQRFKQLMLQESKHTELLEAHDNEQMDNYFEKLEKKEQLEEKMISTHKVSCKAVKCLQCKYINFSASDLCKTERHPLKVFDAMKRFYKCNDCGNRTVTLDVVPLKPCKKCGSGNWIKSGMINEKTINSVHKLSIRGDEQTFVNSNVSNLNLDLLVADSTS